MATAVPGVVELDATLAHYYDELAVALAEIAPTRDTAAGFAPPFRLPALEPAMRSYLSASASSVAELGTYSGRRISLLNLMGNPRTRTTKTFASLVMVARAVEHVRSTGERIMLLTPTSGNKGTALRDAVLRAIEHGLVHRDELGITTVVPSAATGKLWSSPLDARPELRARNPVAVYSGPERAGVKTIARQYSDAFAEELYARYGVRLWYTLDLANYRGADAVRYAIERDVLGPATSGRRLHAHAVSSAFGLLGHVLGRRLAGPAAADAPPSYFLVQHLETPDMVLHLHFGSTDRANLPRYALDGASGLYRQDSDARFPSSTFDPQECLEPTFYTHRPPTADEMTGVIRTQGGGGIVVSLHECLQRYGEIRTMVEPAGVHVPADPRRLKEWSLLMALTGVLNAVDRGLVDHEHVVVHASGSYGDDDFTPIPAGHLDVAETAHDLEPIVDSAVHAMSGLREAVPA
jgi:hypothetical protein